MEPPADLTLPAPSSTTSRTILSAALRRLAGDLFGLPRPGTSPRPAATLRAVLRAARADLDREPGRVFFILRRPNVGTLIRVLRDAPSDHPDLDPLSQRLAATLALELAVAGASLPPLTFESAGSDIVCLGARFSVPAGIARLEARRLITDDRELDLTALDDSSLRRPHHPIRGEIVLATVDDNPLSMFEAHPDKLGNAIDLGGYTVDDWCGSLGDALDRIGEELPEIRAEADLFLHQMVPVGFHAREHLSASYREALGTIYLTLHPNPLTMVEAIVHELSHTKLNALFELDAVLVNAFHPLYRSPVRPDPRPLAGVLLAVHAFVPIEQLYRQLLEKPDEPNGPPRPDLERRYRAICTQNREGAAVLREHAKATALGRGVLEEIERLTSGEPL